MQTFYTRVNSWYRKGYRSVVVNGQKEYMPAFYKRLRQAGIEYHPVYAGKGISWLCSIYVKQAAHEEAKAVCAGLPYDYDRTVMPNCRIRARTRCRTE